MLPNGSAWLTTSFRKPELVWYNKIEMIMKYKTTLLAAVLLLSADLYGQDIHFASFWMTPLLINPAQAGAEHDMRAIINYRNQWNSVATPCALPSVFGIMEN